MTFKLFCPLLSLAVSASVALLPIAVAAANSEELTAKLHLLGDSSITQRETSMRELSEAGTDLLPLIGKMTLGADPEMRWRLRFLERRLIAGVTEESPMRLRLAVDRFPDAGHKQQAKILQALIAEGEWQAAFGLFIVAAQEDPSCIPILREDGLIALRQLCRELILSDDDRALFFLRRAGDFDFGLPTLASYLAQSKNDLSRENPLLRLHIHIQKGEFQPALELAKQFGKTKLEREIRCALGDDTPYLKSLTTQSTSPAAYQLAQWFLAEHEGAGERLNHWRKQLLTQTKNHAQDENFNGKSKDEMVLQSLLLLTAIGEIETARTLMDERWNDYSQAQYFALRENPEKVFLNLGLEGSDEQSIRRWYQQNDIFSYEMESFQIKRNVDFILYFLMERGSYELVRNLIDGSLKKIGQLDNINKAKLTLIRQFGQAMISRRSAINSRSSSYHRLLYDYACELLEEDPEQDVDSLTAAILAPANNLMPHINFISKLNQQSFPTLSAAELLKRNLVILRQSLVPESTRLEWLTRLRISASQQGKESIQQLIDALIASADYASAWEIAREHPDLLSDLGKAMIGRHLIVTKNWEALRQLKIQGSDVDFDFLQSLRLKAELLQSNPKTRQEGADILNNSRKLLLSEGEAIGHYLDELFRQSRDQEAINLLLTQEIVGQQVVMGEAPDQDRYLLESLIRQEQWKVAAAIARKKLIDLLAKDSSLREYRNFPAFLISDAESLRNLLDFARAMDLFTSGDKKQGLDLLEKTILREGVGNLGADLFFPIINRFPGIKSRADKWYQSIDQIFVKSLERFPRCAQSLNGRAWFASRAVSNLDIAEASALASLREDPISGAATDTLAEVKFAQGKRREALEHSQTALRLLPLDSSLMRQMKHFREDPLPKSTR